MRTGAFADEKIVDFLNENFILAWNNHSPDRNTGPAQQYTPAQCKAYPEGGGAGNLRTYFVGSDGVIVGELQGFWSAARYLAEAKFALTLTKANRQLKHAERAKAIREEASKLAKENPGEMRKPVRNSEIRKRVAALQLLARWHQNPTGQKIVALLAQVRQWQTERGIIK